MAMTKTEKLSQFVLVIIALCAVLVSVWQGRISQRQLEISQEHNRLTVKPYIDITRFTNSSDKTLEVKVSNQGYGPAIINSFELIYDGKAYSDWNSVLGEAGEGGNIRYLNNYSEGSLIASGKEQVLMRLETDFNNKNITIKIEYKSIYNEEDSIEFTF
ncbi:hypothetical protein [Roseivirga sp. 4D4]|uniref:hypothetical protein n=1 Tax=Roseivirga sp. 4D4 TaxID=1889784 RepID=UPI001112D3D7|nr:hypothetical protein [Roseivirga sp. 4D4]